MQTTVRGARVAYEETGEGMPVVLIHGYPLNRTMWEPQLQGLADVARVIAPDLPGFGESDVIAGADMSIYADTVRELLDAIGVHEPAVIGGLSMGGYVVFEYYRRYPGHVAGLILSNTKAGADSVEGKVGRDKSIALAQAQGAGAIAEAMLPKMLAPNSYTMNPELVERVKRMMSSTPVPGITTALAAMRERADSTFTLVEIRALSLVLHGAEDQLIPPSEGENIARGITDSQLELIPGAGHLSNLEQPEIFNRAVRNFLVDTLMGGHAPAGKK